MFVIRSELEQQFRDHAWVRYGDRLDVRLVHQRLDDLPSGLQPPPGRQKPWGTGHAVLAVRQLIARRFAVCNADDYYGATVFPTLRRFLRNADSRGAPAHAMVGYTLSETLSDAGGVSRGIGRSDTDGLLTSLDEVLNIRRENGRITGVSVGGDPCVLNGDELVSRNLWGFRSTIFGTLKRAFFEFGRSAELSGRTEDVEAGAAGRPSIEAEFLLSDAVGRAVETRKARVRVLPAGEESFGITHPDDQDVAATRLRLLVAQGLYPTDISAWFRRRR